MNYKYTKHVPGHVQYEGNDQMLMYGEVYELPEDNIQVKELLAMRSLEVAENVKGDQVIKRLPSRDVPIGVEAANSVKTYYADRQAKAIAAREQRGKPVVQAKGPAMPKPNESKTNENINPETK